MLLAPCVVAFWSHLREEAEESTREAAKPIAEEPEAAGDAGLEPLRGVAWEPGLPEMREATAKTGLIRKVLLLLRGRQEGRVEEGSAALIETPSEAPYVVELTLDELLKEAIEVARETRAAATRANAAASDVAARVAAARVGAAAEASRVARRVAEEAAEAELVAQEAYEAVLMREAREEQDEPRPMPERRAA